MIQRAVIRVSDIKKANESLPDSTELTVILEGYRVGGVDYCDATEITSSSEIKPQSEKFSLTLRCEVRDK